MLCTCTLVYRYRYTSFGGDACSCLQGGTRIKNAVLLRSASTFSVGATLKVDAAKAHTNPHDVISQKPGVFISAAVITSYLIATVLSLSVTHCPYVRTMIGTQMAVLQTLNQWVYRKHSVTILPMETLHPLNIH
jgi:hypothetical protein